MADTKSSSPVRAFLDDVTFASAVFVGTGTNIAVAASTVATARDNYAYGCTITDNGVGDFTVLFASGPTRLIDIQITITGPTVLVPVKTVQSISATTGLLTVTFRCRIGNGTVTDPATTDTIRMLIIGSQSSG